MRYIVNAALFGVVAASAAMVGLYAWSVGVAIGPVTGWAFVTGAIALLLFECALPVFVARSWQAGDKLAAAICGAAMCVVVPVVASLDVGFTSTAFADARAHRAVTAIDIGAIPKRAAAQVEAQIDGILLNPKLGGCLTIDGPATRAACPEVAALRLELATARAFEGRTAGGASVSDADARTELLARMTGVDASRWADVLTLWTALALALARITGAAYAFAPAPVAVQAPAPVQEAPPETQPEPAPGPASAVVVHLRDRRPKGFLSSSWMEVSQRDIAGDLGLPVSRVNKQLKDAAALGQIRVDTSTGKTRIRLL